MQGGGSSTAFFLAKRQKCDRIKEKGGDCVDKGLKLLFATCWDEKLWGNTEPTAEDYAQAKAEGYMFDPVPYRSHGETLRQLKSVAAQITPTDVANAFLYSLSTRQLQYRSALGSYYYAIAIPDHIHERMELCYVCNWMPVDDASSPVPGLSEYNDFNFERYKWGGVRHTSAEYALFDLEQFLLLPKVTPTDTDWGILKSILHAMEELPPNKKAGAYREQITKKKLLKSNKSEVEVLLNILGICGVLSGGDAPCYCDRFADVWERSPQEHTNDYAYPVNRWHVSDGVNEERFRKVFGFDFTDL